MVKAKMKSPEPQEERFSVQSLLNPAIIAVSAIVLLLTSIAVTSVFRQKENSSVEESAPTEKLVLLPEGWEKVTKEGYENTYIKKQPEDSTYTPTVSYDRNTVKVTPADEYFATMIAGAKSAIPSLVVTKNEQTKYNGYDVMQLEGNYYQGAIHIQIRQRLLLKGTTLHTIASSFDGAQEVSEQEIDEVFDYIVHNFIQD